MRKRILWISLLITVFGILIFSLGSTQIWYRTSLEHTKQSLRVYMNFFDGGFPPNYEGANAFSEQLNGARVTVMDGAGRVLGESLAGEIETDHSEREEVKLALSDGEGFAVRNSETVGKNMIYFCKATEIGGETYLVRIAVETYSEWALLAKSVPSLVAYLVVDVLGCLLFTYAATYFILRPVERLTREAALGGTVNAAYREFQTVADVLNERNRNLAWHMKEIEEEKRLVERTQASKNEFIANVTHEMNTPLTSIKGYAELLNAGKLTEEQRELAYATIAAQSERLSNLIACIINYNEIDSDDLPAYEVDLSKLARETAAVVAPEAEKRGVTVRLNVADNVVVLSRHERMSELLGNLLRNAIRYNKEGGSVTLELDKTHLSVSDTGVGIAPENIDKVFSRFFTVDKSHSGKNGGFGLGLAVCKKICNRAGWRISVRSQLGVGSTFTVDFSLN